MVLAQENDELEDNPYQGCKLIIRDDKNREFVTTTPGLIRLVSQFIFSACHEKLAEIEASIVFPHAWIAFFNACRQGIKTKNTVKTPFY